MPFKRKPKYSLSSEQTLGFMNIGIRPIEAPNAYIRGDMIGGFMLIPRLKGEWIREHAKKINSEWEGSYIPLIIYKNETAVILVAHKETSQWETLRAKIEAILKMPVAVRGD